jgi:hypothetical protein
MIVWMSLLRLVILASEFYVAIFVSYVFVIKSTVYQNHRLPVRLDE